MCACRLSTRLDCALPRRCEEAAERGAGGEERAGAHRTMAEQPPCCRRGSIIAGRPAGQPRGPRTT
eukprot:3844624-Alexandrium_andersonii.AAC.1